MSDKKERIKQKKRDINSYKNIEKQDLEALNNFLPYFIDLIADLIKKYNLSDEQIKELVLKKVTELSIPVSVFCKELSGLEIIVKYLHENLNLRFSEISSLLNRKYSTISTSYKNSREKYAAKFVVKDFKFVMPLSIFKNRKFSVLELIVSYLKDNYDLKFSEIAVMLHRDIRTIWTVYQRAKRKKWVR